MVRITLALVCLVPASVQAQEDLTVLKPEEQPRRMLYRYLEGECLKHLEARKKTVAALKTPEDVRLRQEDLLFDHLIEHFRAELGERDGIAGIDVHSRRGFQRPIIDVR